MILRAISSSCVAFPIPHSNLRKRVLGVSEAFAVAAPVLTPSVLSVLLCFPLCGAYVHIIVSGV